MTTPPVPATLMVAQVDGSFGDPMKSFDGHSETQSEVKERFYRYFQQEVTALQEQINQLEHLGIAGGERQDAIDHCLAGIAHLSNGVQDASSYIPAYDQRTYSQAVKALSEKLEEARSKFAPKSRFAFKTSQKNHSAISLTDAAQLAAAKRLRVPNTKPGFESSNESSMATTPANLRTPPGEIDSLGDLPSFTKNYNEEMSRSSGPIRKPSFSQASTVTISGHDGLHIILPSSASHATSSGSLTKLKNCIVDMSVPTANGAPFAGISLQNISNSLIIVGQVAGAAHITNVENSVIAVASRQVRIHNCKNVDIYLQSTGRPIIEDCKNIRFAPIPDCYALVSETAAPNLWDQVDDFKWLKTEHSPNWSILPTEERLNENVWTTVVPGAPGTSLDDILKTVGVRAQ